MRSLLAVILISLSSNALAQLNFGPAAGFNYTTIGGARYGEKAKFKGGFFGGGIADISFSEYFGMQAGVLYSAEGYKIAGPTGTVTTSLNYIRVPVCLRYNFYDLSSIVGLYYGYALPQDGVTSGSNAAIKNKDLGFLLGVNYQFDNGIFIKSQYTVGLVDIATQLNTPDIFTNKGLSIGLGYFIGFRRPR